MSMLDPSLQSLPVAIANTLPELIALSLTGTILLILLLVFRIKFYPCAPIVSILALLLFNDLFQIIFELPTYFASNINAACLISTIGTTFFRLATNYWLIFITRLIYRQKFAPGKQIDLNKHLNKHLFLTYMPSIFVSLLLFLVSGLFETKSQYTCWRDIRDKTLSDYIIYTSAFLLPNLIALVLIVRYLVRYINLKPKSHSLFLVYPIVAIPFMIYYLVIKSYTFFLEVTATEGTEVPFIVQPLSHALIFMIVLKNLKTKKSEDELTLKDGSNKDSFMENTRN